MKLVRYGQSGQEKPGALDERGEIRDLSGIIADVDGPSLTIELLDRLRAVNLESLPVVAEHPRLGACVGKVGKIVCVGLNYADHAAESGLPIPEEPVIFLKAPTSLAGPNDEVIRPRGAPKLDWEVELAVVIGKKASYVKEDEALEHIAGYCIMNDISERSYQLERGGTWDKGKGCDTFGPLGPWLVTPDEVPDPENLAMWLEVNGQRYQDGSSRTMIFKPAYLIHYISQFMTLMPGDIISTGTPPGVGLGQSPQPIYLKPGDTMRLGIEGLGVQVQTVVDCDV